MKNRLIATQPFIQKIDGINSTGQLLHLPRFYVEFKPKHILLTEKIIEILKSRPNYMAEYMHIKAQFDVNLHDSVRKLFKMSHFIKFVATDLVIFRILKRFTVKQNLLTTFFFVQLVPYRTVYPNAPKSEWKMKKKSEERIIKVVQLRDPNMEISEAWLGKIDSETDSDEGTYIKHYNQLQCPSFLTNNSLNLFFRSFGGYARSSWGITSEPSVRLYQIKQKPGG